MNFYKFLFSIILAAVVCNASAKSSETEAVVEKIDGNPFGRVVKIAGIEPNAMALCIDGKILYAGSSHYFYTLDISEPMNPQILGKISGLGNVRQMAVQNGIVYIAARESGLWIIDARDPKNPKILSRYDCVELATGVDVAGDVVFLGQRQNGVEFIDVSNPASPQHICIIATPESQSVKYRNGYVFSGEWHKGEVTIFDARDIADIKVVSRPNMDGFGDGIDMQKNLLFASTGHHSLKKGKSKEERFGLGHGLEIFDIADIANPKKLSFVKFPKCYALGNDFWTPRASGDIVFCADTFNGLYAVDIADIAKPRIVGHITTPTTTKGYASSPISSLAVTDGVVYASSMKYGVMAIECSRAKASKETKGVLPKNASFRASYPTDEKKFFVWKPKHSVQVRSVAVEKDVAYAACGADGLAILKLSDKNGFKKIGELKVPFAGDVKIKNGKLYLAEGLGGLGVYEMKSPTKLAEIGRLKSLSQSSSLVLWVWVPDGKYIVASDRQRGISFVDATDLKNMKVVFNQGGCPGWDKYFSGETLGGKYVGMAYANSRFEWFDISGDKPVSSNINKVDKSSLQNGCCAFKGRLLLTKKNGEITILEPNQPANADGSPWKGIKIGGKELRAIPMWNGDRLVSFTRRIAREIAVADFSDEKNPQILWETSISGNPETPTFWGECLLVPAGFQGLLMSK